MVPAAFVLLASMPLTVNGKLDRKALAALPLGPAGEALEAAGEPRTETERRVAAVFAEVLSLERVGPASDFFALGGHSLLATQVASRLAHRLRHRGGGADGCSRRRRSRRSPPASRSC